MKRGWATHVTVSVDRLLKGSWSVAMRPWPMTRIRHSIPAKNPHATRSFLCLNYVFTPTVQRLLYPQRKAPLSHAC